jgi:parvulin-like peptidyl-prolyl isomerase
MDINMMNNCLKFLLIFSITINVFAAKETVVVATVNGEKIFKKELDESFRQRMLFVNDKPASKDSVLDEIINRRLGIALALKNKLNNNPIVKQKMQEVMYHAQISKDLEPLLKRISVTDSDVKNYYKKHMEYRTAHILFRVRAQPDEAEVKAALAQALKVYTSLKTNPDRFAVLANKFSQSSTAPNGGDMGFQPASRLAPEYFTAIKDKDNGYITSPVRTQFGYHIIKILAAKDFKSINMAFYKKIVYDQKRDSILQKYFADLRRGANIKVLVKEL